MTIKHKKGSFRPQWHVTLRLWLTYAWLRLMGRKQCRVQFVFGEHSTYDLKTANQHDWLKAFGSKSGTHTVSNTEEIAAYRYLPKSRQFQVALFSRQPYEGFGISQLKTIGLNHGYKERFRVDASVIVPIGKLLFPVGPWAGGDQKPEEDFQYQLFIY